MVRHGASGEPANGTRPAKSIEVDALLAELNGNTDLAWLVERVVRNKLPWVVVPAAAQLAWAERDPIGWNKVLAWLAVNGITVIRL
jgi:hypothetical protein